MRASEEGERRPKVHCVAAFNEQSAKAIFPKNADPADLAHYVMTVARGIAIQTAGGASRDQLRRVAQIALRAWPTR